jgi:hypothetical protein
MSRGTTQQAAAPQEKAEGHQVAPPARGRGKGKAKEPETQQAAAEPQDAPTGEESESNSNGAEETGQHASTLGDWGM